MTDEQAAAFPRLNLAAQRLALRLEDVDVDRLDFDRWRVANGHDPEWGSSDRRDLSPHCQCATCQALLSEREPVASGFIAP